MTRLSCRSDGDCAQVTGRNRPSMHPTISFHAPDGECGGSSSYSTLPRISQNDVSESDVQSKCITSSGCIGYAYKGHSATNYIYFSSSSAADNAASYSTWSSSSYSSYFQDDMYVYFSSSSAAGDAADSAWSRESSSCSHDCSIKNTNSSNSDYKCYRKSGTYSGM